jgi:hypothetical protein
MTLPIVTAYSGSSILWHLLPPASAEQTPDRSTASMLPLTSWDLTSPQIMIYFNCD